jgi:hypothetical protein
MTSQPVETRLVEGYEQGTPREEIGAELHKGLDVIARHPDDDRSVLMPKGVAGEVESAHPLPPGGGFERGEPVDEEHRSPLGGQPPPQIDPVACQIMPMHRQRDVIRDGLQHDEFGVSFTDQQDEAEVVAQLGDATDLGDVIIHIRARFAARRAAGGARTTPDRCCRGAHSSGAAGRGPRRCHRAHLRCECDAAPRRGRS